MSNNANQAANGDHSAEMLVPSVRQQFIVWSRLGLQSFGGGTATLALIRREIVDELHWISADDFTTYWALVLMAPGINLLGLTVLIGRKTDGNRGILLALLGLLLPSVTVTILMTAVYRDIQHSRLVIYALSGVIPATIGVGIVTGCQLALPVLKRCFKHSGMAVVIALLLFFGSAAMEAAAHWPVVAILLTSGTIGALTQFVGAPQSRGSE